MALLSITNERPDEEIRQAVKQAIDAATTEWAPMRYEAQYPTSGFGITELRPFHIENTTDNIPQSSNLNCWETTVLVSSTWTDWINVTNNRDQYLVITGIFNRDADPSATEIYPSANGQDLPIINIEQMYTLDVARIWFTKPFIVKPNGNLTIQLYAKKGGKDGTAEWIGLMGYCIAKRSRLISKS